MAVKEITLPKKILSRKDEIAHDFFHLLDQHVQNLLDSRTTYRYSASDFAQLLYIHPRHLTNTIKLVTGKSPCDHMEDRIAKEAKTLLAETPFSIAEIAYRFAYNEPTNFTKFFKGMVGLTPLQYRKQIQKN